MFQIGLRPCLLIRKTATMIAAAVAPAPIIMYIIGKPSPRGVIVTVGFILTVSIQGIMAQVNMIPW